MKEHQIKAIHRNFSFFSYNNSVAKSKKEKQYNRVMKITFWGKVRHGAKRGRLLGFPTANMKLHMAVSEGIYISEVKIENTIYPSVTFVGNARTFGEMDYKAESYILDFTREIYGKWLTVTLLVKIRSNKKFDSQESLIHQMDKDILAARKFFNKIK